MLPTKGQNFDRLEQMIERLVTQKACLDYAANIISNVPGLILEIGLGKGRTFDHLRSLFPERELYAFDRDVHAPADVVPEKGYLILGDFRKSLPGAVTKIGRNAALIHADIGSENAATDRALAEVILPSVIQMVKFEGLIVADRELCSTGLIPISLPPGAGQFSYFIYRLDPLFKGRLRSDK